MKRTVFASITLLTCAGLAPLTTLGAVSDTRVTVTPISHATLVLEWEGSTIYVDPVGDPSAFEGQPAPDIVLVTDIHGDHLSADTLSAILAEETALIAPQAVVDALPSALASRAEVLANNEERTIEGFTIEAIPMYNLPDQDQQVFHEKGRGNGYVVEMADYRVYIAGDTADIPEMRALTDIDMAFVPMNLPYTMTVEQAADAVAAFAPTRVYPYHYRGTEGLSDVEHFKELVNMANPDIEVVQLDWYAGE